MAAVLRARYALVVMALVVLLLWTHPVAAAAASSHDGGAVAESHEEDRNTERDAQYNEHRQKLAKAKHDGAHSELDQRMKVHDTHGAAHLAAEPNLQPQRSAAQAAVIAAASGDSGKSFDWLQGALLCLIFGIPAAVSVRILFKT